MDAKPYGSGNPMMVVANGRLVQFDRVLLSFDVLLKVKSNVIDKEITTLDNNPCKIGVVTLLSLALQHAREIPTSILQSALWPFL